MAQAAPRLMTVEDYLGIDESPPYSQLVEGDLFTSPPPFRRHEDVWRNIFSILDQYLLNNPIGEIYASTFGVYLNDVNAFVPDIVFISKKRVHLLSDRGLDGAPDFVVEVLSPKTARLDKGAKRIVCSRRCFGTVARGPESQKHRSLPSTEG